MQTQQCLPDIVNKCQLEDHLASFVPKRGFVVHHQLRVNPAKKVKKNPRFSMDFQNPNLALGSLGEETGEAVGRGEELEESWVPSFRSWK